MDKWKESELEKMKVGGNRKARQFFESHSDYSPLMSFQSKYNSKTAALYREQVGLEEPGLYRLKLSKECICAFSDRS